VRRRKLEAQRLQKEAEEAAASAPQVVAAVEPAPVVAPVAAPVIEVAAEVEPTQHVASTEHTAPEAPATVIDENLRSAEEVVKHHPEALEESHEPKPLA